MKKFIYILFLIFLSTYSYAGSIPIPLDTKGILAFPTELKIENLLKNSISYYYNNIDVDESDYEHYTDLTNINPGIMTDKIDSWKDTNPHCPITFSIRGVGADVKNYLLIATSEKQIGNIEYNMPSEIGMYIRIVNDNYFPKDSEGNTPQDAEYRDKRWQTEPTVLSDLQFVMFEGVIKLSSNNHHLQIQVYNNGQEIAHYEVTNFQIE